MTRIIFYYTHKESLGHTMRTLTLAQELSSRFGPRVKIYLFQAGLPQKFLRSSKQITNVDVPLPFYSKVHFKGGPVDLTQADYRAEFMMKKIEEIDPDIFITEFFPFGRMECFLELFGILLALKKRKVKILASVGYPNFAPEHLKDKGRFFDLVRLYDRIFIHTPPEFENPYYLKAMEHSPLKKEYATLLSGLEKKIEYTGYIFPLVSAQAGPRKGERGKKMILVSRGGGTVYPKLIAGAILSKRYLDDSYSFFIAAGPATSEKQMEFFRRLIKAHKLQNIHLTDYMPDFYDYLKASDLSINLAGYNTAVQLLYLGKRSIVVPYDSKNRSGIVNDQVPRAALLQDYLQSRVIGYDDLKPAPLAQAIKEEVLTKKRGPERLPKVFFQGAGKTAEMIMKG